MRGRRLGWRPAVAAAVGCTLGVLGGPLSVLSGPLGVLTIPTASAAVPGGSILSPATATSTLPLRTGTTPIQQARLAGSDRYQTDASVLSMYPSGVATVFVASGVTFSDALAATAAAGSADPVALVNGGVVSPAVLAQVQRLAPGRVVLVGGPAALPDSVGDELGAYASGGWVASLPRDRYETAAQVSAQQFAPQVPVAFVATGTTFPDALTASALGATVGGPLLLASSTSLPPSTTAELRRLRPMEIDVVGGVGALSPAVATALKAYAPIVQRITGANRYATNTAAVGHLGAVAAVVVATGADFADAAAGSALAAHLGGALVLTDDRTAGLPTGWLAAHAEIGSVVTVGGVAAVSDAVSGAVTTTIQRGTPILAGQPSIAAPAQPQKSRAVRCSAAGSMWCVWSQTDAISIARAGEGLPPLVIPSNWQSLSAPVQLLTLTNLERTARGLPAVTGRTAALDAAAQVGANDRVDPAASSSAGLLMWGSNWAGYPSVLSAWYGWVYDDGADSGNIDCPAAGDAGCWGHRANVFAFANLGPAQTLAFGAAASHGDSFATIIALYDTDLASPTFLAP